MSLSSSIFIFAFLPIALAGYYLLNPKFQNVFLLMISLFFYAWGEPSFVLVFIGSIFLNYLLVLLIEKYRSRKNIAGAVLTLTLIMDISLLAFYKFFDWSTHLIGSISNISFTARDIALPLGISFFTFRLISYVLDVYFEKNAAERNPLNVGLYVAFFPQLTMGPITQFSDFIDQIKNRKTSIELFSRGIKRLIIGLAKKMIIANQLGIVADRAFSLNGSELSVSFAWLGAIAYTLQLFFDFSGYSDIAIGIGQMFGFECAENFNLPYISKSIGEFWRRWHISLGNWLKVYIYTPVIRLFVQMKNPLTKKNFSIQSSDIAALFVVWLVCGIWHGSGWKFVFWGMYYFVFIALERFLNESKKKNKKFKQKTQQHETAISIFTHFYSLLVILFGWVLFRATSLTHAFNYLKNMLGLQENPIADGLSMMFLQDYALIWILAILYSFSLLGKLGTYIKTSTAYSKYLNWISPLIYISLFIISLAYLISGTSNSFLYFKF